MLKSQDFEYNDTILNSTPTGAYTHIVNLILSDERSSWSHNIFSEEYTGLEISIARLNMDIKESCKELNSYKSQIDGLREKIEKLEKVEKKTKDYAKLLNGYNENINNLIENIFNIEEYIDEKKKKKDDLELNHVISLNEHRSLGIAKNNYKLHKNLDYLIKDVHYHCALSDQYRYGPKYVAPYKNHLLTYDTAPFNKETVDRMNYKANDFEYVDPNTEEGMSKLHELFIKRYINW